MRIPLLVSAAAIAMHGAVLEGQSAVRDTIVRTLVAAPLTERPAIDGRLDDRVWQTTAAAAASAAGFRQVEPRDGDPPGQRTDVMIAYDQDALYVAARLYDTQPAAVIARLGRRDTETKSDAFAIGIDSYHDHRTAFHFAVNAAGVRSDYVTANDDRDGDNSWDPVWDVATRIDSAGWTAEMRIPFSQLRFSGAAVQEWGVNFERLIQRTGELDRWQWAPNSETGYASRFGHLVGLRDIASARSHRLEVVPYGVAQGDFDSAADRANPFNSGRTGGIDIGADIKYGVSSSLTLTGTVNPDFGQVEADPAEVNLTVFETYFFERRPFFVEGANLFAFGAGSTGQVFGAPQLFYSRRIGRPPSGAIPQDALFFDDPEVTRILGAAKLSGQVGGWSIGVLDAVTAREEAELLMPGRVRRSIAVEPRANFGVVSLRRDLNGGRTGIGLFGTSLVRAIDTTSLDFLRNSAHSGGVDFFHRFPGNQFSVNGTVSGSWLQGDPLSILVAQRSSARYYQRPDQDYVTLDPTRRHLGGYAVSLSGGKTAGRWLATNDFYAYSPGFEINDAGFQQLADRIFHGARLTRRWLRPTHVFRFASAFVGSQQQWNFGGTRVNTAANTGFNVQFRNYWSLNMNGTVSGGALNDKVTRGGPLALVPPQWNIGGFLSSDSRRATTLNVSANTTRNRSGGYGKFASASVAFRPSTALSLSVTPTYNETHSAAGFVTAVADPTATTTYGRRYIVAEQTQQTFDVIVRTDVALTPKLSLQFYAQPFASAAEFWNLKTFVRPTQFEFLVYGRDGASTISYDDSTHIYRADADGAGPSQAVSFRNPEISLRSMRANLVLRWEYRPGSTFYIAWAHGRSTFGDDRRLDLAHDFEDLLHDDQRNRLVLKMSYWLNP